MGKRDSDKTEVQPLPLKTDFISWVRRILSEWRYLMGFGERPGARR